MATRLLLQKPWCQAAVAQTRRWKSSEVAVNLILMRHGQSRWNAKNRFTGWTDVKLTEQGEREAWAAGRLLSTGAFAVKFDVVFTSHLTRAQKTTALVLEAARQPDVDVVKSWRLNERHYGALTGLSKMETMSRLGEEKVMSIRRGTEAPPLLDENHPMWPHVMRDEKNVLLDRRGELPRGESLPACRERVAQFWRSDIYPRLAELARSSPKKETPTVLIVSHMHTLRLLIAEIDELDGDQLRQLLLPTATPLRYRLDMQLAPIDSRLAASPQPELRGRWLGDLDLSAMTVEVIRSNLLRRPAMLYELVPHLPERVQTVLTRAGLADEAMAHARDARKLFYDDRDDSNVPLRAAGQIHALSFLFAGRPWLEEVSEQLCDACARALAVPLKIKRLCQRRTAALIDTCAALVPDDDDDYDDDDGDHPDMYLKSWAQSTHRMPARAAVAALSKINRGTLKARDCGAPVKVEQFPAFAKLVAVVAYLTWLHEHGAKFLPERGCSFARDFARPGMLSHKEILEDLEPLNVPASSPPVVRKAASASPSSGLWQENLNRLIHSRRDSRQQARLTTGKTNYDPTRRN